MYVKKIRKRKFTTSILYKDTLLANAEYPEDCKYKLDASMPIPVVTESFKAHGKELLDYMLGHEGPDVVLWGATSGGGSGATDSNYADYDGQIAQEYGTVAEQVAVLRAQLEEIWSAYYKQYQSGGYDGKEVRNVITEKSSAYRKQVHGMERLLMRHHLPIHSKSHRQTLRQHQTLNLITPS